MKNKFFKWAKDESTGLAVEKINLFTIHKWHCKLIKKHGNPVCDTGHVIAELRQGKAMSASLTIFDGEDNRTLTVYDFSTVQSFNDHKSLIDSLFSGELLLNQIP